MVNKIIPASVVGGVLALGVGGGGYYVHNQLSDLQEQQAGHTLVLKKNETARGEEKLAWNTERRTMQGNFTDLKQRYDKLGGDFERYKIDVPKIVADYTTKSADDIRKQNDQALKEYGDLLKATDRKAMDTESVVRDLAGKVDDGGLKIGKLETGVASLSKKVGNIKTGDEEMDELYKNNAPSVVGILYHTLVNGKISPGSLTGSLIQNKEGKYAILTAGHGFENPIVDGTVRILLHKGKRFDIDLSKTEVHVLGADDRDVALILVPEKYQKALRDFKIKGVSIAPASSRPKESNTLLVIGENWQPYPLTFAGETRKWHGWRFEKVDYETRGAPAKRGESGSVAIGKDGNVHGILSRGPAAIVNIPLLAEGKVVGNAPLIVNGAVVPGHTFVSAPDIHRALRNFGFEAASFTDADRNLLVIEDILKNRPYLFAPPGPSFSNTLSYLGQVADLEPYLLESKKK